MSEEKKQIFGVSMSPDLLEKIDKERRIIKRSTYIEFMMKEALEWIELRQKAFTLCDEIEKIVTERYPTMDHPLMSPAAQMMKNDIRERILEIKKLLKSVF